jgi:hypothetical protein
MTTEQEWKHQVWRRWLRITRRKPTANISADIMVRQNEQLTMADAIDAFDNRINKPNAYSLT